MPHTKNYRLYSPLPELPLHKTWAEIDLGALKHNIRVCKEIVPPHTKLISVVKADAYGHGAGMIASTLLGEGCDFFSVSCVDEAIPLRKVINESGKKADLLILGYTLPEQVKELVDNDIIQTVFSPEYAESMARAARDLGVTIRCHIKLDTGMNRLGFGATNEDEIRNTVNEIVRIASIGGLQIEGLFSHFARADEMDEVNGQIKLKDGGLTEKQFKRFMMVDGLLRQNGLEIPFRHICNSAAAVRFPDYALEGVRLGILQFGVAPIQDAPMALKPVMKLCTVVSHLHTLQPGETVSYGGKFRAKAQMTLATLPIGYADGFMRAYSGASVVVETTSGKAQAPIVGRICMDQCMIDVTGLHVRVGDKVVLFGDKPEDLQLLAQQANTIPYECLCLVSARVPRVYLNNDGV